MVQPEIEGMELLGLVGEGACGSIFIARDLEGSPPTLPDTKWYALRVYNALAINRPLIENMSKRLEGGTYPKGVIPFVWKDSKQGSRCMVMPMLADIDEQEATIATRSLQDKIGDYPETDAWPVIEKIASALAGMHQRRIAHGNLKPGNIFFDENGEVFLTDFAMGQMPGVGVLPYTDALLYAPPEQLRDPEAYLSGQGYTWDTYAFAVLAFRLLTGKFPRCEATFHRVAPGPGEGHMTGIEADLNKLAERLEHRELANWSDEATDGRERKRREVIQKCLSLNPEDRYADMNQVLHAWHIIDSDTEAAKQKAGLLKNARLSKTLMMGSLALAGAGVVACIVLAGMLALQKSERREDAETSNRKISELEKQRNQSITEKSIALVDKRAAQQREKTSLQQLSSLETNFRKQLGSLGATNDHLFEWIMRSTSEEFPELKISEHGSDVIERELRKFLELTEGDKQANAIRARIQMQLAELAIHRSNPQEADKLLELAESAWTKADVQEPGYPMRMARARLACLLQSLDKQEAALTHKLLPKARQHIQEISSGDANEIRRNNAILQIIDGTIIEKTEPAKALEHFLLALKDLEGVHNALPEHIALRSQLARYSLQSATIAENLDLIEDASKLRSKAASHLRWILEKNPELKLAKVKLAEIEILSAESDMRSGNDSEGSAKLQAAEKLLSSLDAEDTTADGAAMQMALAKGLRSVLQRDQGNTKDATQTLEEATGIMKKIVAEHPDAREPLYRLAVFHWQRAGLFGDSGDDAGELDEGKQAAALMQRLLKAGAGKRDTELRRSLAYLYGDLGHTAQHKGLKGDASGFFKNAATMWQSLIDKNGKTEEYTDGLQWSQSRYREVDKK